MGVTRFFLVQLHASVAMLCARSARFTQVGSTYFVHKPLFNQAG
ncbi:hypothetical protein HMPREF3232_01285 [Fannyhessea vaginae]|nr:hypothetical protein HMPREF3232_01285 [Fannyhessea vaginae]